MDDEWKISSFLQTGKKLNVASIKAFKITFHRSSTYLKQLNLEVEIIDRHQ